MNFILVALAFSLIKCNKSEQLRELADGFDYDYSKNGADWGA